MAAAGAVLVSAAGIGLALTRADDEPGRFGVVVWAFADTEGARRAFRCHRFTIAIEGAVLVVKTSITRR